MNIIITGRKVNLKDNFKELVEKKLKKFERIFSEDAKAQVTVTVEKNRQTVEVTIRDKNMIYRSEKTLPEMNEALDAVMDSLGRQIRKNKCRLEKKLRYSALDNFISELPDDNSEVDQNEEYELIREKRFIVKPLLVQEAILQMNMLDHKFFMFKNTETDEINVVYLRKDGTYGLLEPEV